MSNGFRKVYIFKLYNYTRYTVAIAKLVATSMKTSTLLKQREVSNFVILRDIFSLQAVANAKYEWLHTLFKTLSHLAKTSTDLSSGFHKFITFRLPDKISTCVIIVFKRLVSFRPAHCVVV